MGEKCLICDVKTTEIREAFWMFLPQGLDELFEMVRFERTDNTYDIWLDEKKPISPF